MPLMDYSYFISATICWVSVMWLHRSRCAPLGQCSGLSVVLTGDFMSLPLALETSSLVWYLSRFASSLNPGGTSRPSSKIGPRSGSGVGCLVISPRRTVCNELDSCNDARADNR
jgi:hypothetical protein